MGQVRAGYSEPSRRHLVVKNMTTVSTIAQNQHLILCSLLKKYNAQLMVILIKSNDIIEKLSQPNIDPLGIINSSSLP